MKSKLLMQHPEVHDQRFVPYIENLKCCFQGCEGKLTSLVSESGHKLTTALLSFCVTSGELAMATNSQVIQLDQQAMDSEQLKVKHFTSGV